MLGPSLTVMHLVIASVCTVIMLALGFLPRPQRSTVLWSAMFIVAMLAAVGAMTWEGRDSRVFWLASMACVLTIPFLAWAGLRAHRGAARTYAWSAPIIGFAVLGILFVGAGIGGQAFHVIGRVTMLAVAIVNVLVIAELMRRPERGRGAAAPLLLVSVLWIVMSVIGVIASVLNLTQNYELLTQANAVALACYLICALVSLLLFARGDRLSVVTADGSAFRVAASDRLRRAQAAGERTWALLDIRLDDTDDLRAAAGDTAFRGLTVRFHDIVRATFPAEADIGAVADTRALVLVSRTDSMIRSLVRDLAERLQHTDADAPIMLQLSASIGWADAEAAGYDLDALISAAQERAENAIADGGDRVHQS